MAEVVSHRRWPKPISMLFKSILSLLGFYVFVSLLLPTVLIVCPGIVKHLVFLNILKTGTNFSDPEAFGLDRVHNFYLDVEPGVRLGVWHFRSPLIADQPFGDSEDYFRKHLASDHSKIPLLIYLHGNAFDRSVFTRRGLCQKLRHELKYDIFSIDYRGFGDSTGEPTEEGLIRDARYVYDWLQNVTNGERKIYIWGQSLGSGVACQLAARLSKDESNSLGGLVLEAPFINIHQAMLTHWSALLFRWQPWFYGLTEKALRSNKLAFQTRGHLSSLNCPCVLLHAADDYTVPYVHSKQLLQAGLAARDDHRKKKTLPHFQMEMISFHDGGYGHSMIYHAPKLVPALKRVVFEEHL